MSFIIILPSFPLGPHALQQITSQLNPIPEEMLAVSAEIMARRIELLNLLRGKHRTDRNTYLTVSTPAVIVNESHFSTSPNRCLLL